MTDSQTRPTRWGPALLVGAAGVLGLLGAVAPWSRLTVQKEVYDYFGNEKTIPLANIARTGPTLARITFAVFGALALWVAICVLRRKETPRLGESIALLGGSGVVVFVWETLRLGKDRTEMALSYSHWGPSWPQANSVSGVGLMLILAGSLAAMSGGLWLIASTRGEEGRPKKSRDRGFFMSATLVSVLCVVAAALPTTDSQVPRLETAGSEYELLLSADLSGSLCSSGCPSLSPEPSFQVDSGHLPDIRWVDGATSSSASNGYAVSFAPQAGASTDTASALPVRIGLAILSRNGQCIDLVVEDPLTPRAFAYGMGSSPEACTGQAALAAEVASTRIASTWVVFGDRGQEWPTLW